MHSEFAPHAIALLEVEMRCFCSSVLRFFDKVKTAQLRPVYAVQAATSAQRQHGEGLLRAAREGCPTGLDFNRLCDRGSIFQLNSEMPDCTVLCGMAEKQLDRAQVAGFLVALRDLGSSHGMRTIGACLKAD